MSCSCGQSTCSGDPCSSAAPVGSAYETLASALDNFILNFYGSITKTVIDGKVVWILPCDLAGIIGTYARDPALGTACYFKSILTDLDLRVTAEGQTVAIALSAAQAAQVATALVSATIATYGDIVVQNKNAVNLTGGTIAGVAVTGLPAPSSAGDAVTKAYADALSGGISPQLSVRVASTGNLSLTAAGATIDGITMALNDRVLVKNQTTTSQNGIYTYNAGVLTRAADANTAGGLTKNRYYFVAAGTTNAGTGWFVSTQPTTLGTDPVIFSQFSASSTYTAGAGLLLAGTQFTLDTSIAMQRAQNLADVANAATARSNLGLGSIATQAANAVALTGGAIDGIVIGASSALAGTFSTLSALISLVVGDGGSTRHAKITLNGGNTSGYGSAIIFQRGGGTNGAIGLESELFGGSSSDVAVYANTGGILKFYANNIIQAYVKASGEFLAGFGVFTSPIATYDSAGGGLYLGYGAGNGLIRAVSDNSGTPAPFLMQVGNNTVAQFIATGMAPPSFAYGRSTKANYNLRINVKDYGAYGTGGDDTSGLNAAIAAMTNDSELYFPPGVYGTTGLNAIAGLTRIKISGDGATLYNITSGAGSNTMVVENSCSHVEISSLRFTGNASSRGSGIHLRMRASQARVHHCYFSGCSDFAIHVTYESGGMSSFVSVDNNLIENTYGDGIHIGSATDVVVSNNVIRNTGDDAIAVVADYAGLNPTRIILTGNLIYGAGFGPSGVSGSGFSLLECNDVLVEGNQVYTSYQANLLVGRNSSTTFVSSRISIKNNKFYNGNAGVNGAYGAVWVTHCDQTEVANNQIIDPAYQSGIAFLNTCDLRVSGNFIRGAVSRGIRACPDTTNVRTTWSQVFITNNDLDWVQAAEAIYAYPGTGITITNLMICGNTAHLVGANWIYYNQISTGRVFNNTNTSGVSPLAGGTVTGVTAGNNN